MSIALQAIINNAIEELEERIRDENETGYINDIISEIADSTVYNHDLLELAAQENALALREPEIGPAFDGTSTPVNIIAANLYELITQALFAAWSDTLKDAWVCTECDTLWEGGADLLNTDENPDEWNVCPECSGICRELTVRN